MLPTGATGLSSVVELGGMTLAAIYMPAAWTAAALTFQACPTADGTFQDVYADDGTGTAMAELSIPVAQGKVYTFDAAAMKLAPFRYVKFRSGTSATPVSQASDRTLILILKA